MSVLSDALPTSINNLRNDAAYTNGPFANAIYDDFTSGTPPPWFTAMPNAVQSFLILDYIPNWMSERPMALRVLGETAQPGASPTSSIPTSTLTPIQTSLSTAMDPELFSDTAPEPSDRHLVPIVVGTIVSVVVLAALLALILLLMRRKRRQRDEAHYPKAEVQDTKRPARRFSDTTFISNNNGSSRYYSSQHIGQQRPLPEISISPEPSRLEHGHSRSESAAISAVGGTEADGSGRSEGAGGERSELEAPRSTSPGMASSFRSELAAGGDEEAGRPSMERHY